MFRVIIAGCRDFNDYELLERSMDKLLVNITEDIAVVCGMARGPILSVRHTPRAEGMKCIISLQTGTSSVNLPDIGATSRWLKTQTHS